MRHDTAGGVVRNVPVLTNREVVVGFNMFHVPLGILHGCCTQRPGEGIHVPGIHRRPMRRRLPQTPGHVSDWVWVVTCGSFRLRQAECVCACVPRVKVIFPAIYIRYLG